MTARNLKIPILLDAWRVETNAPNLKIKLLEPVLDAHRRNIRRVYSLTVFPLELVAGVTVVQRTSSNLLHDLEAEIEAGKISRDELKQRTVAAMVAAANEREEILSKKDNVAKQFRDEEERYATTMINTMLASDLQDGSDAWFGAQITGIWTSFEAVAGDLWEAALNIHPFGLADLAGNPKEKQRKGRDENKKIDLSWLQRFDYNVVGKMGTILKSKYGFDKLDSIRDAYSEAFGDKAINAIIEDKTLTALSLVRNLIVHKGGVVDDDYLKRKNDLPPSAIADFGKSLPMDGELTGALISRPIILGIELIMAVDNWISSQEKKKSA
jgi:hypothetical protein